MNINKNKDEVTSINKRIKEINKRLKHLTDCAIEYLSGILAKFTPEQLARHTQLASFSAVEVKQIVKRDLSLRYDEKGYLGTAVSSGQELFAGWQAPISTLSLQDREPLKVTPFDRIFYMRHSGIYSVCDVPQRLFVDTGLWYCNFADKDIISKVLFTIIYREPKTKFCFIKRCRIPSWIMNRDYLIVPEGMEVLHVDVREAFEFTLNYVKKPRLKIKSENFKSSDYEEKGHKTQGVRLSDKETESVTVN